MLYGNVQTGHNQGTYNTIVNTPTFNNAVKPQDLLGFTVGSKNRFFGDDLEINIEGYYYRYKDFLLSAFDALAGTAVAVNAPRASIKGAQIDLCYLVTRRDLFTANVGILDARIDRFIDGLGKNYADFRLPDAPVYTVNLGYQHNFPLYSRVSVVSCRFLGFGGILCALFA
jgi:iron complex outermembrane receptor protein